MKDTKDNKEKVMELRRSRGEMGRVGYQTMYQILKKM